MRIAPGRCRPSADRITCRRIQALSGFHSPLTKAGQKWACLTMGPRLACLTMGRRWACLPMGLTLNSGQGTVEVRESLPDGIEFKAVWSHLRQSGVAKFGTVHFFDKG